MNISKMVFSVGALCFILAIVQWNLHAEDGWIGEKWDSDKQEKLYYNVLIPASVLCIFTTWVLMFVGI